MSDTKVDQAAEVLKLMAHPIRIRIILALTERSSVNVSTLQQQLQVDISLLSHCLTKMRDHGLLECSRQGKERYYSLTNSSITQALMILLNREMSR
ncbi:ArsR/SmtB family transcription factor [Spirosoma sp. KNUC1025]|uniref:ArsR/SmtB family transcription factor n=1 Tax=Spirosoma sp. KNUC1025 TaxID=2894082 RepID=UPI0038670E08